MKTLSFDTKEEWLEARKGKITGSTLKEIYSTRGSVKQGYYQLILDRMGIKEGDEKPLDRGVRLETIALDHFEKETGKAVGTIARQFIETMIYSYSKSKTEMIDNNINAVFEIMDIDNRIISKLEDNLIEFKSKIDIALDEVNKQRIYKSRSTRNLFSGMVE
jgi:hypothetical protein